MDHCVTCTNAFLSPECGAASRSPGGVGCERYVRTNPCDWCADCGYDIAAHRSVCPMGSPTECGCDGYLPYVDLLLGTYFDIPSGTVVQGGECPFLTMARVSLSILRSVRHG